MFHGLHLQTTVLNRGSPKSNSLKIVSEHQQQRTKNGYKVVLLALTSSYLPLLDLFIFFEHMYKVMDGMYVYCSSTYWVQSSSEVVFFSYILELSWYFLLNFMFSKKATQIWQNLPKFVYVSVPSKKNWDILSNFWGLLKKHEHYKLKKIF